MGLFSFNCKCCGHPILLPEATESKNGWMSQGVVINSDGSIFIGEYDGYGSVGHHELEYYSGAWYHKACWEACGKPMTLDAIPKYGITEGPSDSASDQGWFFDDGVHNMEKPDHNTFLGGDFKKYNSEHHSILNP